MPNSQNDPEGAQSEVSIIAAAPSENGTARSGQAVANYLTKYVTKSLPTSPAGPGSGALRAHHHKIAQACRLLSRRHEFAGLQLADRIETLGYPSRPTSRSRAYSTTMGALRAERAHYVAARQADPIKGGDQGEVIRESTWVYAGRGWNNLGEAAYVATKAAQRIDAISHAAEARARERDLDVDRR